MKHKISDRNQRVLLEMSVNEILCGHNSHTCIEVLMCILVDALIQAEFPEEKLDDLTNVLRDIYKIKLNILVKE